ncbi:MAG: endonuclease/exonuclease/phosphatase family protein [Verrucomicrobiia bacterium]
MDNYSDNTSVRKEKEIFDSIADWIIELLKNRHQESSPIKRLQNIIRLSVSLVTILYILFLLLIYTGIEFIGQRWWLTAFLSYLPQTIWLAPLFIVSIFAIIFSRKTMMLIGVAAIFVIAALMKPNFSFLFKNIKPDIVVMTNNIGQDNKQSLSPFIKSQNPDIIVLQETAGRTRQFTNSFPQYSYLQVGEFGILSKFKILNYKTIVVPEKTWLSIGVRCEILFSNTTLAIYNIHIPSPRNDLLKSTGRGFIIASIGNIYNNGRFGKYKNELQDSWNQRVRYYELLKSEIEKEDKPFIVAGDLNLPNYGPLYRMLCKDLKDSFNECGFGFGYTFPGETLNPLSLFGPWLRIDYIFAGKGCVPTFSKVESNRKSQHLAVAAGFKINNE